MNDYNLAADCLNKYSQLTPWVQALLGMGAFTVMLGAAYFMKETVVAIMRPFLRTPHDALFKMITNNNPTRQWRDKYYRDENAH